MKSDSSTNIKNNFASYLNQVKAGQVVLILEHGKPVAQMAKPTSFDDDKLGLVGLEKQGFISFPSSPSSINVEDFLGRLPKFGNKASLLSALQKEREEGY